MRQGQARLVECDIVVGQQVDIDAARPPALLVRAVAAERALDLECAREQRLGESAVSTAIAQLMKGGWSVTPQGGVA